MSGRKFLPGHIDGWVGATLLLGTVAIAASGLGISHRLGEHLSAMLLFGGWCVGLLVIFMLALHLPARLGGNGFLRVMAEIVLALAGVAIAFLGNAGVYRHDLHLDVSREGNNTPPPQLQSVLQTLSEREAGVVKLRFGLTDGQPRTLDEIGQVYGVTRERIRQIESKTMSKLRHPSRSQVLRDYLD